MSYAAWHIAVLIPARDEEQLIGRCLRSVLHARKRLPEQVTCDIVVVSDSSTDRTLLIADQLLQSSAGLAVATEVQNVGRARALAAHLALARCPGSPERCWLANTDADCEVPEEWLLQQLAHAEEGWSAVAGIVDVDTFEEHDAGVKERFRESYLTFADGTHPHVHGANLGLRADVYEEAGGWASLVTAEDHDLWGRVRELPVRCYADAKLCVLTSGRRVGRAPLGFAGALAMHNQVAS